MTSKEALDRLKFIADKELNTGSKSYKDLQDFWNYKDPLKVISDLVEKDTPLKPNDNLMKGYYHCSKCGREIPECVNKHFMRYCSNCGQKLKGDKKL